MLVGRMSRKTVQFHLRLALVGLGVVLFGISLSSLPTYVEFSLYYATTSWFLTALVVVHNSIQILLARCRIRESGTSTLTLFIHGLILFASIFLTTLVVMAPPPPWQPPRFLFQGLCIRTADASIACSGAIVILQIILILVEAAWEPENQPQPQIRLEKDPSALLLSPLHPEDLEKAAGVNTIKS